MNVYGSSDAALFPICEISAWIASDVSDETWLEMVASDCEVISTSNKHNSAIWVVNESGMKAILSSELVKDGTVYMEAIQNSIHPSDFNSKSTNLYTFEELLSNPEFVIAAFKRLKREQERNKQLSAEIESHKKEISTLISKAEYYDKVLSSENAISIAVIAKEYGKSATWLNRWLHTNRIQYKLSGLWVLYSNYADRGYTCTKTHYYTDEFGNTHSTIHTYWTQSGRQFIFEKLAEHGINPIEK